MGPERLGTDQQSLLKQQQKLLVVLALKEEAVYMVAVATVRRDISESDADRLLYFCPKLVVLR